ncbi:MAG: hypothetical protein MUF18_03210 [Fimbriiglobus sp.]|jgi:hypothetical protein|nr:hypothetical protein [Fimbriiglobus sp.]
MIRSFSVCVLALVLSGSAFAQCCEVPGTVVPGGLLTTLNAPLIPGLSTVPGMPTHSILGLVAPRLSTFQTFTQAGGFNSPNAGQFVIGMAAPRVAPLLALQSGAITPGQAVLGVVSPRAALGLQVAQGLMNAGGGVGGGGLLGRRCR